MLETDQERTLLATIVKHPDDVQARRALADVLKARGEPWGELIELQCKESRTDEDRARIKQLLADWRRFAGALEPFCEKSALRRGFIERVTMKISELIRHGETVFSQHPVTELVVADLQFTPALLTKLAQSPVLARVRRLVLQHKPNAKKTSALAPLASSPYLTNLRELALLHCGHSTDDWKQLFAMTAPALETIRLRGCQTSVQWYAALSQNPSLSRVREIDEWQTTSLDTAADTPTATLVTAFTALARCGTLERLTVAGNQDLTIDVLRPLFAGANAPGLVHLDLHSNTMQLRSDALALLSSSPALARLESLAVNVAAELAPEAFASFVAASSLRTLQLWTATWAPQVTHRLVEQLVVLPRHHPLGEVRCSHMSLDDCSALAARFSSG